MGIHTTKSILILDRTNRARNLKIHTLLRDNDHLLVRALVVCCLLVCLQGISQGTPFPIRTKLDHHRSPHRHRSQLVGKNHLGHYHLCHLSHLDRLANHQTMGLNHQLNIQDTVPLLRNHSPMHTRPIQRTLGNPILISSFLSLHNRLLLRNLHYLHIGLHFRNIRDMHFQNNPRPRSLRCIHNQVSMGHISHSQTSCSQCLLGACDLCSNLRRPICKIVP